MISDKLAEDIARSLLDPFIDMGIVTDDALAASIKLVKLKGEAEDAEKRAEEAEASLAVQTMLLHAVKGLPR